MQGPQQVEDDVLQDHLGAGRDVAVSLGDLLAGLSRSSEHSGELVRELVVLRQVVVEHTPVEAKAVGTACAKHA